MSAQCHIAQRANDQLGLASADHLTPASHDSLSFTDAGKDPTRMGVMLFVEVEMEEEDAPLSKDSGPLCRILGPDRSPRTRPQATYPPTWA